jgi:glycosyltransferase involved in cell wall biosynthesis
MKPPHHYAKIKIVRVIARLDIGGAPIHVVELGAGLNADRFESLLVSGLENPGERSLVDYVEQRGIHPLVIPEIVGEANFGLRDLIAIAKLYRVLKREKPHIVDTHTAKAGFVGRIAARLAGVPVVIHTYHGHVWRGYYSSIKSRLLQLMEKGLALWTDQIITVSESVRQEIAEYGIAPLAKIKVVPLGFDLRAFFNCAERRGPFRKEIGVPPDVPLIGTIGRVVPIKNHRLFLDAAKLVLNAIPEARFVIVGDGLIRPDLESYARTLGIAARVVFAGWRRDLPNIYADLDVVVISSINEGTPISAIEAMAAERPVVATRVGGVPDIVLDGRTGALVPLGDATAMADAIVRLLRDPELARQMGETGRAFVSQNFTTERLAADMEKLYITLLANKGFVALNETVSANGRTE